MKLVSIQVGGPRDIHAAGGMVRTSIWKHPVSGPVRVTRLNLAGDLQSDLSVHGGAAKAVYLYPSEHYDAWRRELRDVPAPGLSWGAFGENLTTEGLLEEEVEIGDHLLIGSAEFAVTQPRMPCAKLGIRFGRPEMVREFLESRRSGFYLSVVREGELAPGDPIRRVSAGAHGITVTDVVTAYATGMEHPDLIRRVAALPVLSEGLRNHFLKRLGEAGG